MPQRPRKVVLFELNEITWTIAAPMMALGRLPHLARMRREGAWGAPEALERPPHLDPWITWVTLHTGVDRSVHGASVLEQDAGSIAARRTWEWVADAGRSIGVFGSIGAYPPRPVPGFVVPGPFAPGSETFPEYLRPVQELNRRYTRIHNHIAGEPSARETLASLAALFALGLRPATVARIARHLAAERLRPHLVWRRPSLQPLVNFDVFAHLYRRYRPDYATWHTNHAAHYMHHFWRAMDDTGFPTGATADEKARYGSAVEHGYELCDELVGRLLALVDRDTVVIVASSMGQKPYVHELYPEGKIPVRFRDVHAVLGIVGARGVTEVVPTMLPQWNVRIPDPGERARVQALLGRARCQGGACDEAMTVEETGDILTLTPRGLARRAAEVRYFFPDAPQARADGYPLEELFACDVPTPKEGMHDPRGLVMFYGAGLRRGLALEDVSPLDIAPTILALLDVPVPATMKGRVLRELWAELPAAPRAARDAG